MRQILFSCVGTSDPVRGEHDGPMLHILRHYRPACVYLFLTPEIAALAGQDRRFEKTFAWVTAHWDSYQCAYHPIICKVTRAHDMDALDAPLHEAVAQISRAHPDAEILLNLTSGTPQMQMILAQLATDMRYRTKGIQVSNFEKKSGSTERTNTNGYDVELELECNEDEQSDAENRCTEPRMLTVRREYLRRQITTLLDRRDFDAVEALKGDLPETLMLLTQHLAARNRLQSNVAQPLAAQLQTLPFPLYAYRSGPRRKYSEISEYYLMTKNLVRAGNCTEFLLHLEPLVLALELSTLDRLLPVGSSTADFVLLENGHHIFHPELLQSKLPALYQHYSQSIRDVKCCDMSTFLCGKLLSFFADVPEKAASLFAHYNALKELRNRLAHSLYTVTAKDVRDVCGVEPEKLLDEIEKTIIAAFPVCDPSVFSVYDKSIAYIKAQL